MSNNDIPLFWKEGQDASMEVMALLKDKYSFDGLEIVNFFADMFASTAHWYLETDTIEGSSRIVGVMAANRFRLQESLRGKESINE